MVDVDEAQERPHESDLNDFADNANERYTTADEAAAARLAAETDAPDWSKEFVENVDAQRLVIRDLDPDWASTKSSYTRDDIRGIVENLEEVQRLKKSGYAAADFQRMRESTDPAEHQLGQTEYRFYSPDSGHRVEVTWNGDEWEVEKGRHRVALAQERGMRDIPAVVHAPDRSLIDNARRGG